MLKALTEPGDRYAWHAAAACRHGPAELFFGPDREPPLERAERETHAVEICRGCSVRERCRAHALELPEWFGVWGGTTEAERVRLLRRQRAAPAA